MLYKYFENVHLYDAAYDNKFLSSELFIERNLFYMFMSKRSTCTYGFDRSGPVFEVWVRPYRKRSWSLLFSSESARAVLQDLYDFLYV